MKKVLYIGWYDQDNIGDEMYKVAFPILFPDRESRFAGVIRKDDVAWADEVVVGGGNIIDKNFINLIKNHVKSKPVHFYSAGFTSNDVSKKDLERYDRIWVRDVRAHRRMTALGVKVDLAPDAAWIMKPNKGQSKQTWEELFKDQNSDLYDKKVVVVLNGHLTTSQPDLLARDLTTWHSFSNHLKEIIDSTSASFAFVPFGRKLPWDDRVPNGWAAHKCKWFKKNTVVWDGDWSAQKTLDFIGGADAVISMRLHSTIFSTIAGTPFIDVTHHDKNRGFLESVGHEHFGVDYWKFDPSHAKALLDGMLDDGDKYRRSLEAVAGEQRRKLLEYTTKVT